MSTNQTKELIEKYIRFFGGSNRSTHELDALLDSHVSFRGPLGKFEDSHAFLEDIKQDKLLIDSIRVQQIIADGEKASALYEVVSKDPEIGTVKISEWFEVKDGRISSITSTYDASDVKTVHTRI